jgi:hypothetical protein
MQTQKRLTWLALYWGGYLTLFTLIEGSTNHDFINVLRNEVISLPAKIIFVWLVTSQLFDKLLNERSRAKAIASYIALIAGFALILRLLDNYVILKYFLINWSKEPLLSAAPFLYSMIKLQFLLTLPFCVQLYHYFQKSVEKTSLMVKCERRMISILFDDIAYVEAQGNYLRIFTLYGTYKTYLSISELEVKLPSSRFIRIHRSFLVALNKVKSYNHSHVIVAGKKIPIGRSYANGRKSFQ